MFTFKKYKLRTFAFNVVGVGKQNSFYFGEKLLVSLSVKSSFHISSKPFAATLCLVSSFGLCKFMRLNYPGQSTAIIKTITERCDFPGTKIIWFSGQTIISIT